MISLPFDDACLVGIANTLPLAVLTGEVVAAVLVGGVPGVAVREEVSLHYACKHGETVSHKNGYQIIS